MLLSNFAVLCFAWFLRIHCHNLDAIGVEVDGIIELEIDVFDYKCPNFVAKAVGIEVALQKSVRSS